MRQEIASDVSRMRQEIASDVSRLPLVTNWWKIPTQRKTIRLRDFMPVIYVIGGCNGAGKTTSALNILPRLSITEFVNADTIAANLSPENPESAAMQAGRLTLERLRVLADVRADFAFETTLSARTFAPFLRQCQAKGYLVSLIFFWLQNVELAVERVAQRVASGGHSIPEADIRRRYERGKRNLTELYLPLCHDWLVYDNSSLESSLIAEGRQNQPETVYNERVWFQISERTNE
jgi:predicted ABC-type ATPase